jgi:hypothetical protein
MPLIETDRLNIDYQVAILYRWVMILVSNKNFKQIPSQLEEHNIRTQYQHLYYTCIIIVKNSVSKSFSKKNYIPGVLSSLVFTTTKLFLKQKEETTKIDYIQIFNYASSFTTTYTVHSFSVFLSFSAVCVFLLNFHYSDVCINGHPFLIMRAVVGGTHGYNPYCTTFPFTLYVGSMFSILGTMIDATLCWPCRGTLTCIKIFPRIITFWIAITSVLDVLHFTASFQGYLPAKHEKNKKK